MADDPQRSEPRVKRAWAVILAWIGGISAVIGLAGTLTGIFGNIQDHFHNHADLDAKMATAQTQLRQGEYQASVETDADILKTNPRYQPALDEQLNTTMLWVENFSVLEPEGRNGDALGGPQLDEIFAILDAALTRSQGPRAADVEAHLGWAHWLNRHIAQREFSPVAEHDLRAALSLDSSNVYANAMLGNWMLQNGGSFDEAIAHFQTALATGKARPLVRFMQIGGLTSSESAQGRAELIRAANDMRKNNEPLDERSRSRILFECFDPSSNGQSRLIESLSVVPSDDAWQTYLWLDDRAGDKNKSRLFARDFIHANLLEIGGKRPEALAEYRALQQELKNQHSTLEDPVAGAVKRLSHNQ